MMFNFLDTINLIAVTQLIFFSVFLILRVRTTDPGKILLSFMMVQLLSYGNYFLIRFGNEDSFWLYSITVPAGFMVTPLYYFYIRSRLFRNSASFRGLFIHSVPAMISLILVLLDITLFKLNAGMIRWLSEYPVFNTTLHIQILCYNVAAWSLIRRYKKSIEDYYSTSNYKKIGWIGFLIYSYIITSCVIGTLEIVFPLNGIMIVSYVIFWFFLNVIFLKALVLPVDIADIDAAEQTRSTVNDDTVRSVFPMIENTMNEDKLFLHPELTIKGLSEHLKLSERTVSQVISQKTGLHFSEFINFHRIEYAKGKLAETPDRKLTVLEVLYDSGFNSKSAFNFQFRKFTGKSPSQFRAEYSIVHKKGKNSPDS